MNFITHGKYGLSWPKNLSTFQAELKLYVDDELRESSPKALRKHEHMINAMKEVFPKRYLTWHKWLERSVEAWCYDPIASEWGASSMGKSSDYGVISLIDVLADPSNTMSVFVTNPLGMHHERSYKYVKMYHSILPECFRWLHEKKQDPLGMLFDHERLNKHLPQDQQYPARRSGVVCFSNKQGDTTEDMKRRIGSHLPRMRLIVDEAPACSSTILNLIANMSAGSKVDYIERFMGNPSLRGDPLSIHSCPEDDDWEKTQHLSEWVTKRVYNGKRGKCYVRDGRDSPAIDDPEEYPFLSGQKNIDDARINFGGENSKEFQTYIIGRLQLHGGGNVAITEADLESLDAYRKVIWHDGWTDYAGLDPDSEGKDGNELYRVRVGREVEGRMIAAIVEKSDITVNINQPDKSGQVAKQILKALTRWNIPLNRLSSDVTGNQGAIVDRIELESKTKDRVYRVQASGKCSSEKPIFEGSHIKRIDRYHNRATEMFYNIVIAAQQKQLVFRHQSNNEIDLDVVHQLTSRQTSQDHDKLRGKTAIESKDLWRKRNSGKSPNKLDALQQIFAQIIETGVLVLNEGASKTASQSQYQSRNPNQGWMKRKTRRSKVARRY